MESQGCVSLLILNDDCLLEIFKLLDLSDLCAVADVCSRFRQIAKKSFRCTREKSLNLRCDIDSIDNSAKSCLLKVARVLRNLGEFINELNDDRMSLCHNRNWNRMSRELYRSRIIKLVIRYCSGTITGLMLNDIEIANELVPAMQPLFRRLRKLTLGLCRIGQEFLNKLPLWLPNLREFDFELFVAHSDLVARTQLDFSCLHHRFENLMKLTLRNVHDVTNENIEAMLQSNPQLKAIRLYECEKVDREILRAVAFNAPNVEFLLCDLDLDLDIADAGHFSRMANLKSLTLMFEWRCRQNVQHMAAAIHAMATANIQLEHLRLLFFDCRQFADPLINSILELKNLKSLYLREVPEGLNISHIHSLCKRLSGLQELRLCMRSTPSIESITEMLRYANQLEFLCILSNTNLQEKYIVTMDTYSEWLKIVNRRPTQTNLEIFLDERCYISTDVSPVPPDDTHPQQQRQLLLEIESQGAFFICDHLKDIAAWNGIQPETDNRIV